MVLYACRHLTGCACRHVNDCVCTQASEYTRTSHLDSITIPQAPRLGTQVVEVENLSKSYGDRLLIKDLSFRVPPGSVVGKLFTPNLCWRSRHMLNVLAVLFSANGLNV